MNASRQKGTRWESAIVDFLLNYWPHVERRTLNGSKDRGDIAGIPGVVIEAKNSNRTQLAGWVDEATVEGRNAEARVAAVWMHRKGKASAAQGYVVMSGLQFVKLLKDAGY